MARARRRQRAADFHEWRKEVKALWYQLRLVEGSSHGMRRDVQALRRAETWLGDDHNIVVLCAQLSSDASLGRSQIDVKRLQCTADEYQRRLREKSIAKARAIYAIRSGVYLRRIKRAWKAWHRQQRTRRRSSARRSAA
jgi:hypothetical protein